MSRLPTQTADQETRPRTHQEQHIEHPGGAGTENIGRGIGEGFCRDLASFLLGMAAVALLDYVSTIDRPRAIQIARRQLRHGPDQSEDSR